MSNSSIAVVIPVLNAESTIGRCIDSILSQSYNDFEVYIQDGGSLDHTKKIIFEYLNKDIRIKYFNFSDSGTYDAMNKLMPQVKSDWVLFLGADDCLYNSEVFNCFIQNSKKNSQVFYGNVFIDGKVPWASNLVKYDGQFNLSKLLKRNICHQAIFYRTSTLLSFSVPYNTDYFISADWDLNLRLWSKEPFCYIDFIVSKFNSGGISSSNRVDTKFKSDFLINILKYFGFFVFFTHLVRLSLKYFRKKFIFQ